MTGSPLFAMTLLANKKNGKINVQNGKKSVRNAKKRNENVYEKSSIGVNSAEIRNPVLATVELVIRPLWHMFPLVGMHIQSAKRPPYVFMIGTSSRLNVISTWIIDALATEISADVG